MAEHAVTAPRTRPDMVGSFRADLRARSAYAEGAGIYRILPSAVALPKTVGDLTALVRWARGEGTSLVVRGAGSAVSGSSVGDGVIVDMTSLGPVELEIDPTRARAHTSTGVTWEALTETAGPHGLRLPPDPSSGGFATLGGMVATNAAGARSLRYGPVRPWVQGLDLVSADGETFRLERGSSPARGMCQAVDRFLRDAAPALEAAADDIRSRFPRTTKNTSGLAFDAFLETGDLVDLFIGSEGTLGIHTGIDWRLAPRPTAVAGLLVELGRPDVLTDVVGELRRLGASAIELLDRTFLALAEVEPAPVGDAALLVEFEGDDDASLRGRVGDAVRAVEDQVLNVRTALGRYETGALWRLRHAASPTLARMSDTHRSLQVIEDGCVPVAQLATYLQFVRTTAASLDVPVVIFGHAGDGHLHVNVLPDISRSGWEASVEILFDRVTDEIVRLGGTPAGEHGDGRLRAGVVERLYGPAIMALFRRVKDAFDPSGIFNPGVTFPEPWPPLARLKAGPEAAPLPPDIAAGLRALEQHAGYRTPRLHLADRT